MIFFIGIFLTTIFVVLAVLHLYWGLGGTWAFDLTIPSSNSREKVLNPGPAACFIVAIILLIVAILILEKIDVMKVLFPKSILHSALWLISFLFIARSIGEFNYIGFFKTVKNTPFGKLDTKLYSPLCLLIGILLLILQWQ